MSGNVTLDGVPVNNGTLVLTPIDASAGTSTGGAVQEGRYDVAAHTGPRRGVTYRVEISALSTNGATMSPGLYPTCRDTIPAKYNAQSQLQIAIPNDIDRLEHNFVLTTDNRTRN